MLRAQFAPLLALTIGYTLIGCTVPTQAGPMWNQQTPGSSSSGSGGGAPGGGSSDAGGASDGPAAPVGEGGACAAIQATTTSSHNAGQECLSCHTTISSVALRWTVAGTLWNDAYATAPRAGATVTVVDSAGLSIAMVTDVNGNFYSTKPVKLPLHPSATGCTTMAMTEAASNGSCNSSNCHNGTQPMYVP